MRNGRNEHTISAQERREHKTRGGFTLLEVLVAVVILGVGIAGVLGALSTLSRSEDRSRELEKMQRLAIDKLNELRATTDQFTTNDSGDFKDRGEDNYVWDLEVEPTGTENLDAITVTVERASSSDTSPKAEVTQLVFQQPQDTGGTTS